MRFMRESSEDTPRSHAKDAIARMILSRGYKVGDKLPPYRDLAAHFGVAARTLVRALHELAEQGTLQLMHGKGVFVKRMPPGFGGLHTVGLVYPASQLNLVSQHYLHQILIGIVNLCGLNDLDLQIVAFRRSTQPTFAPVPPRELALRLDGMVLLGMVNDRYVTEFAQEVIPLVLVDAQTQAAPVPCIAVDNAWAVNLLMDHLHGLGHRRIAYADFRSKDDLARGGEPFRVDTADTRERREAYLAALGRLGLDYARVYPPVKWVKAEHAPRATAAAVLAALRKDREPPTAVVCYDDGIAGYLYQELADGGLRVPQDISVAAAASAMGSNVVGSQIITCALIDFREMGDRAIKVLLQQTKGHSRALSKVERIGGTLYPGTTTARPRRP